MIYKVLAFREAFDVLESSLNKWAADGWRVVAIWQHPLKSYPITVIMERMRGAGDDPDEAEAQRIAEQFDEARAELDRGL